MHADGGVSNGNVALAPRKSELYTMPSQDPTDDWLEHLCVHEFRHVVQLDKDLPKTCIISSGRFFLLQ